MPAQVKYSGDETAGRRLYMLAMKQLAILKEHMALGGLNDYHRVLHIDDGSSILCRSYFGFDMVCIYAPLSIQEDTGHWEDFNGADLSNTSDRIWFMYNWYSGEYLAPSENELLFRLTGGQLQITPQGGDDSYFYLATSFYDAPISANLLSIQLSVTETEASLASEDDWYVLLYVYGVDESGSLTYQYYFLSGKDGAENPIIYEGDIVALPENGVCNCAIPSEMVSIHGMEFWIESPSNERKFYSDWVDFTPEVTQPTQLCEFQFKMTRGDGQAVDMDTLSIDEVTLYSGDSADLNGPGYTVDDRTLCLFDKRIEEGTGDPIIYIRFNGLATTGYWVEVACDKSLYSIYPDAYYYTYLGNIGNDTRVLPERTLPYAVNGGVPETYEWDLPYWLINDMPSHTYKQAAAYSNAYTSGTGVFLDRTKVLVKDTDSTDNSYLVPKSYLKYAVGGASAAFEDIASDEVWMLRMSGNTSGPPDQAVFSDVLKSIKSISSSVEFDVGYRVLPIRFVGYANMDPESGVYWPLMVTPQVVATIEADNATILPPESVIPMTSHYVGPTRTELAQTWATENPANVSSGSVGEDTFYIQVTDEATGETYSDAGTDYSIVRASLGGLIDGETGSSIDYCNNMTCYFMLIYIRPSGQLIE